MKSNALKRQLIVSMKTVAGLDTLSPSLPSLLPGKDSVHSASQETNGKSVWLGTG